MLRGTRKRNRAWILLPSESRAEGFTEFFVLFIRPRK